LFDDGRVRGEGNRGMMMTMIGGWREEKLLSEEQGSRWIGGGAMKVGLWIGWRRGGEEERRREGG
jgi:hypothetical protein